MTAPRRSACGWTLVSVPYFEWNALWHRKRDERKSRRRQYLRRQLEVALGEASPATRPGDGGAPSPPPQRKAGGTKRRTLSVAERLQAAAKRSW